VTSVDESETIGGDRKIYFHITTVKEVTITDFAVETADDGAMSDVETIGGTGNDIVIEPSGAYSEGSADGKGSGYTTDGTVYPLDANATVGADGRANVTISEFITADGSTYTFNTGDSEFTTQTGPWDLAITLGFRDGSDVTFYLDVPDGG
ncbi:MAG: hypothetical protein R3324_08900, partial [Halobacteriales archaeon]|nr:hypothetical protein [Halobacteriales archaeon]